MMLHQWGPNNSLATLLSNVVSFDNTALLFWLILPDYARYKKRLHRGDMGCA